MVLRHTLHTTHTAGPAALNDAQPHSRCWRDSVDWLPELELTLRAHASASGVLGQAAAHHFDAAGKRLRARLALATCDALSLPHGAGLELAAAVELLHEASLVHDDLQDRDRERRGSPTVWAHFGPDVALLLGDHLIAQSFAAVGRLDSSRLGGVVKRHALVVRQLAEGQVTDVCTWTETSATREAYERVARAKTGTLLAHPVAAACELAGVHADHLERAVEAQIEIGIAFQVVDDLADVLGHKGRAANTDARLQRPNALQLEDGAATDLPSRARRIERARGHVDDAQARALAHRAELPIRLRRVLEDFARDVEAPLHRWLDKLEGVA